MRFQCFLISSHVDDRSVVLPLFLWLLNLNPLLKDGFLFLFKNLVFLRMFMQQMLFKTTKVEKSFPTFIDGTNMLFSTILLIRKAYQILMSFEMLFEIWIRAKPLFAFITSKWLFALMLVSNMSVSVRNLRKLCAATWIVTDVFFLFVMDFRVLLQRIKQRKGFSTNSTIPLGSLTIRNFAHHLWFHEFTYEPKAIVSLKMLIDNLHNYIWRTFVEEYLL